MDEKITKAQEELLNLSDEAMSELLFSLPWQYDPETQGYAGTAGQRTIIENKNSTIAGYDRERLQSLCWEKFQDSPLVGPSIRGITGRIAGKNFGFYSEVWEIQEVIDEETEDPRNRLYHYWNKWIARAFIEGELFLNMNLHNDGFVEIDFIDPISIKGEDTDSTGIIYHPNKAGMPLCYQIYNNETDSLQSSGLIKQIPSIYIAYYPELWKYVEENLQYNKEVGVERINDSKFKKLGGFKEFMVSWDRGYMTKRNISHLRTVLKWLNQYEMMKDVEYDHKRSASAYLWVFTIDDPRKFKTWMAMSDADKKKTAPMAKKTPGSSIIVPPGMKLEVMNPSLPKISETDTDLLHMVTAGIDEPEDVATGQSKGTFASVKASRQPFSDRTANEQAYFQRFAIFDFWKPLFYLRSSVTNFPKTFIKKEAIDFKNKKPVMKDIKRPPHKLIEVVFPTSEMNDYEGIARGLLGVKHGSVKDTLGVPNSEILGRMGIGNYKTLRLKNATEDEEYPELIATADAESAQEKKIEPPRPGKEVVPKTKEVKPDAKK